MKSLLHPKTDFLIEIALVNPPHALLIFGKSGSNRSEVATEVASRLLDIEPSQVDMYPYVQTVDTAETNISIEQIRSLQQFLKLKVPDKNKREVNRIVIIVDAERMKTDAQNTLLKTLEEPPQSTVIILTSQEPSKLLPTIASRLQSIELLPVPIGQARAFAEKSGKDLSDFDKAYAISGGQAELLSALLEQSSHPLMEEIANAKQILTTSPAERLARVDDLTKDKAKIWSLLEAMLRLTHAGISSSGKKNDYKNTEKWLNIQAKVLESMRYLESNVQPKLVLDNLFINI